MTNLSQENGRRAALIETLEKGTDEATMALLIELKEFGDVFYLNTLLNIAIGNRSNELKRAVVEFISDIKIQEAASEIAHFIEDNFSKSDVTSLVTASWQSRLNFASHIDIFLNILIAGEYKIAFEAFTVIENSIDSVSVETLTSLIETVKSKLPKHDRDKQLLLLEMVSVLDKVRRV